jgi:hypothetical protein
MDLEMTGLELGKNKRMIDGYDVTITIVPTDSQPLYRDYEWLSAQYVKYGKNMQTIATECGVTPMCINNWLRRHNINTRSRGARKVN